MNYLSACVLYWLGSFLVSKPEDLGAISPLNRVDSQPLLPSPLGAPLGKPAYPRHLVASPSGTPLSRGERNTS